MLLLERTKEIARYLVANRPLWRVIMEEDKMRLITGQLVTSWKILTDLETKFKMEVDDVIFIPSYGITVSMKILDSN